MNDSEADQSDRIDVAALSAGIVAVVISISLSPDAYNILNFAISVTLMLVIVAYAWNAGRTFLQTVAFSAALALSAVPAIAFFDEALRSQHPLSYVIGIEDWVCEIDGGKDPCSENGSSDSRVENQDLVVGWLVFLGLSISIDRKRQKKMAHRRSAAMLA